MPVKTIATFLFFIPFLYISCTGYHPAGLTDETAPVHSPQEELKSFQLQPGLRIQLVAAEPLVQDPVVMQFDTDGRLWVVEMRGFMPDIDGKQEKDSIGRISILSDTNGDGQMDSSVIWADSLVLPRALALVKRGALFADQRKLWFSEDTDDDGKADKFTLIDSVYADGPSPEHSSNGLLRNIDNWYYNARSKYRYRLTAKGWIKDSTEFRGQWGISHDDEGSLYYNYNWSQLHADLVPPNYFFRNPEHTPTTGIDHGLTIDRRVYPIRPNPAVNRGYVPGTLDAKGRLLEFTAACSPFYYRGASMPEEFYGNVFVCEPSGNLIKRNVVKKEELTIQAFDPFPGKEFLASTDERFRPVYISSGPDGLLYVADMYRGLVQHGSYVTPYLREQTLKRKLDAPVHLGRIWRIVPENHNPVHLKKLSAFRTEELIAALSFQDGWWRDQAQRLLVENGDGSVIQPLTALVVDTSANALGRYHALWTLEGLGLLTPELLLGLLADADHRISVSAMQLLEPFAESDAGVRSRFAGQLKRLSATFSGKKWLQVSLSAGVFENNTCFDLLASILSRYDSSALLRDAVMSSLNGKESLFMHYLWPLDYLDVQSPGKAIFLESLSTAILRRGKADEIQSLLNRVAINEPGWKEQAVITAVSVYGKNPSKKRVRLPEAPILAGRRSNDNSPVVKAVYALFAWPGHEIDTAKAQPKKPLSESDSKQFIRGRQVYLTSCAGCHGNDGRGLNRFAPPLSGSDWVTGDERRLVLIVLHGLEGPLEVSGKKYDKPDILPVMPAHSTLDDNDISAVLTYIRNEWQNESGAVGRGIVGKTRHMSQGRVVPWTAAELNQHIKDTKQSPQK